jgi:hypothetical protein
MVPDAADPKPSAVSRWRRRRAAEGFVRVEVQVRRDDAALLRAVAAALADPRRAADARAVLRARIAGRGGLKALLAAAPLEDVDLARPRDFGRDAPG